MNEASFIFDINTQPDGCARQRLELWKLEPAWSPFAINVKLLSVMGLFVLYARIPSISKNKV